MTDVFLYLPGMLTGWLILVVGAFSPGPAVALVVGISVEQGRTAGLMATTGIALGSTTINILTMLGVSTLVNQAPFVLTVLHWAVAGYLLYLAYGAFKKAIHPPDISISKTVNQTHARHFVTGYLLQVVNPKAISFWLTIAAVDAVRGAVLPIILLFVLGCTVISFVCHGFWAVALSQHSVRTAYLSRRWWIEMALGVCFIFFALRFGIWA